MALVESGGRSLNPPVAPLSSVLLCDVINLGPKEEFLAGGILPGRR
jgi:hypothetical protein